MTEMIPMCWCFSATTTAPKCNLSFVLFIVDLRPRGTMGVDGSMSCSTGKYSRHPEILNSMRLFEKKKKLISLFGVQNDSLNQQNGSKTLYSLSEDEENTTLSDFLERLTKAAILFFFFRLAQALYPSNFPSLLQMWCWLRHWKQKSSWIKHFCQRNSLQLSEQRPVTFENKSHEAPIWEYGHWLVWLCYHLNLEGQKKMFPHSFSMEKNWA